jgi:hypothetical protein
MLIYIATLLGLAKINRDTFPNREACMGAKGSRPGCARVGAEGETEHGAERRKVLQRHSGSKHSRSCRRN